MASALIGFGAVAFTGVYATTARRIGRPGVLEEAVRYFRARAIGEWALLAVPVLGVAAVEVQPRGGGLGQAWVAVALGLWAVAAAVVAGIARPARRALRSALSLGAGGPAAGPVDVAGAKAAAGHLAVAAAVCDAVFVLAAIDMVIKP